MTKTTLQDLEAAFKKVLDQKIDLAPQTDLREFIKDSIDLGEVLAVLDLEIDLNTFKGVVTVEDFLAKLNK